MIIALIAIIHISTLPTTHLRAFPTPKHVVPRSAPEWKAAGRRWDLDVSEMTALFTLPTSPTLPTMLCSILDEALSASEMKQVRTSQKRKNGRRQSDSASSAGRSGKGKEIPNVRNQRQED